MANVNINLSQLPDSMLVTLAENLRDPQALSEIALCESPYVRLRILRNPDVPTAILKKYARDESLDICRAVAKHPNVTTDILAILADRFGTDHKIAMCVVQDRDMPTGVLAKLVSTGCWPDEDVNEEIAKNPNVDENILRQLAGNSHNSDFCFFLVAVNPKTPKDLLESLARRLDAFVYLALALNPNTPQNVLKRVENCKGKNMTYYPWSDGINFQPYISAAARIIRQSDSKK